jgi:chromosome segregation ATPase
MITITEKRLQELEHRIPVYEATIAQLNLKLQAVNTFPEDIQSLKEICKQVVADMKGHTSSVSLLRTELSNTANNLKGQDELFSKSLTDIERQISSSNTNLDNMVSYFNEIKRQFADLLQSFAQVKSDIESLKKSDAKIESDSKNVASNLLAYTQNADLFKKAAVDTTAFSSSVAVKFDEQKDQIRYLKEATQTSLMDLQRLITSNVVDLERKIPKQTETKNYDLEIADLKKDMAVFLEAVHTTSKEVPNQSKVDAKVKTLEKSIAQIYELLKKYER